MDITTCPFCHLRVLSVELERHANSHFDDEDVVNDFELGRDVALAPSSSPQVSSATLRKTGAWERPESSSSSSRMDGRASEGRDLGERISCLVNLQMKGSFYHVEGGMINMLRSCLELEPENCVSRLCGYVDHFESIASEDVGWGVDGAIFRCSALICSNKDKKQGTFSLVAQGLYLISLRSRDGLKLPGNKALIWLGRKTLIKKSMEKEIGLELQNVLPSSVLLVFVLE
nr:Zinc finger with UFM1-specific peptidase domain protein [Ipomoea batatas]